MVRWNVLAAAVAVVVGAALVTGASVRPKDDVKPAGGRPPAAGNKTGYFNMARVTREYKFAENMGKELNSERARLAATLTQWRAQHAKLQQEIQADATGKLKQERGEELLALARKIEDEDRKAGQALNERAAKGIAQIYDNMHAAAAALAKAEGLVAVLAYPDAITPDQLANPQIKEMKLKPPAAYPFYLDPSVDYTDELIKRLNAKFVIGGAKE
jgi:Skp family chaperone for outer membrane proteins